MPRGKGRPNVCFWSSLKLDPFTHTCHYCDVVLQSEVDLLHPENKQDKYQAGSQISQFILLPNLYYQLIYDPTFWLDLTQFNLNKLPHYNTTNPDLIHLQKTLNTQNAPRQLQQRRFRRRNFRNRHSASFSLSPSLPHPPSKILPRTLTPLPARHSSRRPLTHSRRSSRHRRTRPRQHNQQHNGDESRWRRVAGVDRWS